MTKYKGPFLGGIIKKTVIEIWSFEAQMQKFRTKSQKINKILRFEILIEIFNKHGQKYHYIIQIG